MALELTGSRVLAPFLGASLFVWTSLIGIILASLSLGYLVGGKIADRKPEIALYSLLLFSASGLVAIIPVLHYPLLGILSSKGLDLRLAALTGSVLLFSLPSVFLGAVSPFAVRLRLNDLEACGATVGRLYALSTLGSIAGTFVSGFVLISLLGTNQILLLISAVLLLMSVLVAPFEKLTFKLLLVLALGLLVHINSVNSGYLKHAGLIDLDTAYYRAFVLTQKNKANGRELRTLSTDALGGQSLMYLDDPTALTGDYTQYYHLALHYNPDIKRILIIGGGAYTVPKYFLANYPEIKLDVVEIDPGMTRIARDYFELRDHPALSIFHEDARRFIARSAPSVYDAVFVDAFGSSPTVPFHLTTKEMFESLTKTLKPRGLMFMNVISGLEGETGLFGRALLETLESVFSDVQLYAVYGPYSLQRTQNLIFIASQTKLSAPNGPVDAQLSDLLEHRIENEISRDMPLLTDAFAPVEFYMLQALLEWQKRVA